MDAARKCLFFGLLSPIMAHAAIFMCKDSTGRTLTSDRPIPECAANMREYSQKGVFKREVAALQSPEQKRLFEEQQRQKRVEEEKRREQQRADRAFMLRYPSEANIETARQRESAFLVNLIAQHKATLQGVSGDKPAGQVASTGRLHDMQRRLQESENELARINQKYDGMLQRYREIVGK